MTAPELWQKIAAQFLATPLPGVPPEYVRSFLTRFEAVFIAALQKRFDALHLAGPPRDTPEPPGDRIQDESIAALETELLARGFLSQTPKHGATAVWSLKARKQGIDVEVDAVQWGDELQLTRHQGRDTTDEQKVSGLEGLKETLDLWGIARQLQVTPQGPEANHVPDLASEAHHQLSGLKPETHRTSEGLEPIVPGVLSRATSKGLPSSAPDEAPHTASSLPAEPTMSAAAPVDATPVPTHDGGLRGPMLESAAVVKGDRVVTSKGEHGRVEHVDAWGISGRTRQTEYRFHVRLDSGRIEQYQSVLYQEVSPPSRIVPDISYDGKNFLSPAEAWKSLKTDYTQIRYYLEKADRARRADAIQEHKRGAADSQARLLRNFATFYTWREQHTDVEIDGFISHLYRIIELMSGAVPRWRRELDQLGRLPQDQEWGDDLVAGDGVIWNNAGSGEQVYGRITAIEGRQALVASRFGGAPIRLPLYYLLLDGRTPLQVPSYTEPVYLVALASSMLSAQDRHPKRGAVAAAVKRFLAHHQIDAHTRVPDGAGMTVITLRAPEGTVWTPNEVAFMEGALDLTIDRSREASFEPWRTQAAEWSSYQEYADKGAGIRIAAEHVPTFAHLFASALKDSGQHLNRLGTAWLIRGLIPAHTPNATASSTASGEASPTQARESTVEGCRELEFFLPGYGQIRVVCGAHGRRDVWQNLFIGRSRYGFNGSRWSKGNIPDPAVLNAVASRGITIFGGRRVSDHADNIRYL